MQRQELLIEPRGAEEKIKCLIMTDTDPLSGRPRKGPLERYLDPPSGVHYTIRSDRFTYPKQVGHYALSPLPFGLSTVRFLLEHILPFNQKRYSLIHSYWWNIHKFSVPWVHENDQSFGQFLENYAHIRGFLRRAMTEKFASYLNWCMCKSVIVPSQWAKRGYSDEGVDSSKIRVIPPPFRPINDRREHEGCNILFIGRDYVRKGGETALDAFEKLSDFPDAHLIYVGKVDDGRAIRRIRSNKRIIHYPKTSDFVLSEEILPVADIFLFPTRADAFPSSVPEAMGRGIPVVASNICALPETIEESVSGYLCDPGDAEQFTERLAKLIEDPRRREKMGESAQSSVKRNFSNAKLNAALKEVYENAIA